MADARQACDQALPLAIVRELVKHADIQVDRHYHARGMLEAHELGNGDRVEIPGVV